MLCPVILSIPALIIGYQGRSEIRASQGRQSGGGLATAGIVLGWIGVALGVGAALLILGAGVLISTDSSDEGTGTFEVEPDLNAIFALLPL